MKVLDIHKINAIGGIHLGEDETFSFRCHSKLDCFTQCCRNLNLFLYPYDVIRLKNRLGLSSDQFLEMYVDIIQRESNFFPDVVLRMSEDKEKTCLFLNESGCTIYQDRPDTCRMFPVEVGMLHNEEAKKDTLVYFFKPPEFCLGKYEKKTWTGKTWAADQEAEIYRKMAIRWAGLKRLFQSNPWGNEGVYGPKGKMAFMAIYNVDQFRDFVYNSSFLKRYKVKHEILKKIRNDDVALMKLGFDWVKFFLWGIESRHIKPR